MRLSRSEETKAISDFIGYEIRVAAVDFTVMEIIVLLFGAYVRGQSGWKFFWFVLRNKIDNMIRDQRRKPSHMLARLLQIIRDPDRRGCHDFDLAWISTCCLGALLYESNTPGDEIGVSELEDHAVRDSTCQIQDLGSVSS